jgi:flavin reductase (DIM6/NTAB) family NADH-FMN oxidoreductase RutF/rubredoxin
MDNKVLRDISYGMYVVTANYNNRFVGCTINTLTQITSKNPIISISLNKDNYTNEAIKNTKRFVVNILSEKTSHEVINTFGFKTSKDVDKFRDCEYEIKDQLPILKEEICGYLICEVLNVIDAETHDVILARIIDMNKISDNIPMTYKYYHEVIKGITPKNAPTYYIKPEHNTGNLYRCSVCGYIYDDSKESIPFDNLPEDWKCPVCGSPKSVFKKI